MKKILASVLILLIAFITWRLVSTMASLNDTSSTRVSVAAASLNFKLNGDSTNSLKLDLGEVKPGDFGVATITVNNIGTIPGSLCIKGESFSPGFTVQSADICGVSVDPSGSVQFIINWSLPLSAHSTGLDGTDFQFSYSFTLVNGFKITKLVDLTGKVSDPADTVIPTPTETPTDTLVPTATDTPLPTATDTLVPTPTDTPVP
jgi:hypothetical protein